MLEMRNFLNKKINKKGFTLAELLVVVAIIAIIVAVSIPIFTGKLNEAKKSTDDANVRAAKAVVTNAILQKDFDLTADTFFAFDAEKGTVVAATDAATVPAGIEGYGKYKKGTVDQVDKVIIVTVTAPTGDVKEPTIETNWVAATK